LSEMAHPVHGKSGLTDQERQIILYVTMRAVADRLGVSDQEAADILDSYAETGDSSIIGDQQQVSMVVDGIELVRFDRAWLRAVSQRGAPAMN
jgi:hypothetical protein